MTNTINKIQELSLELSKLKPLKPELQLKLDKKFRLEFNYNSNHIEGNTLSYAETELLLIFDETNDNHTFSEYEEMKAHDVALALIKEWSADKESPFTEVNIKNLNKIILVKPFFKDAITPDGQKTRKKIKIGDYKDSPNNVILDNGEIFGYASVIDTPILMNELVQWYRNEEQKKELHPVELAALLHYKFVCIHPFDDGNGRISRLLMNYVLLKNNLPPVVIKSADKKNYLSALRNADIGNVRVFVEYIARQLEWSLQLSIKAAKGENIEESDDLEKEISLLDKAIKITSRKNIKNNESVLLIWNSSLSMLLNRYLEKFSSFEKLFNIKRIVVSYDIVNNGGSHSSVQELNEWFQSYREIAKISSINVFYFFEGMKSLYYNTNSLITFCFDINFYTVSIDGILIKKQYNEVMDSEEIEDLIKTSSEKFLEKIKREINRE